MRNADNITRALDPEELLSIASACHRLWSDLRAPTAAAWWRMAPSHEAYAAAWRMVGLGGPELIAELERPSRPAPGTLLAPRGYSDGAAGAVSQPRRTARGTPAPAWAPQCFGSHLGDGLALVCSARPF